MLERDPQEHVRLYNERFDYFVEFIEKGQIWFDNDHQISLALKKLREVYAKKNTSEKEHKHGWIYDLTRALSVVSRCVNVQKTFDMLHKANSAYLERQVNKGASVAISKRNCPYMTFLTLRLNPHVFHMPLNTTTFSHVKKQAASIQVNKDIGKCLVQMERENMSLGAVLQTMSPGTEADFLARFATRVLGEVSIDDLPPVMQVHDLIAHYQLHMKDALKSLIETGYMLRLIHATPSWRIWLRSKMSVLRMCNREEFEFMFFVRLKLEHYWPGKRELIALVEKRQVTNIEQIEPGLFKWAHSELFETNKKYAVWLFVLRNDSHFSINPAGDITLQHHAIVKPERIEAPLASSTPPPSSQQSLKVSGSVLYRLFEMKSLKTRTIDQVLTLLKKQYSTLLLLNCARFIQYDLCLAFHCNDDEKIEAYRDFLSDVFLRTVFKVSHFNELTVERLGPMLVTEDNIDSESIGAHLGIVPSRKRVAQDNDNDDDDEPITESLARMKGKDDPEQLDGVVRKKKKISTLPVVKTERQESTSVQTEPTTMTPSKIKPNQFKGALTNDEARHVFRWASGLVVEFNQMIQNIRVSSKLDGIKTDLLLYLASLHAYVNGGRFEFGSFLGRLACYYKTNQSIKQAEMEPEASGMEGIYYFPVEYDVPRVDGELHEKLEQRVSSLLQTTTELFISDGDEIRLVENCHDQVNSLFEGLKDNPNWRSLEEWLPEPEMLFIEPCILNDEESQEDDTIDAQSILDLIIEHGAATYGCGVKVRVLDTVRDAINAHLLLVLNLALIEASTRFNEIKQLLSTQTNSAYATEWIDDHMYIEFN